MHGIMGLFVWLHDAQTGIKLLFRSYRNVKYFRSLDYSRTSRLSRDYYIKLQLEAYSTKKK